jgi:hypothetical protein
MAVFQRIYIWEIPCLYSKPRYRHQKRIQSEKGKTIFKFSLPEKLVDAQPPLFTPQVNSTRWAIGWTIEKTWIDSRKKRKEIFLSSKASRPDRRTTQPPILFLSRVFLQIYGGRNVKRIIFLVVARLRLNGAIPLLLHSPSWSKWRQLCHYYIIKYYKKTNLLPLKNIACLFQT